MNDILYRAGHKVTYNIRIQLFISASTTELEVKSGLEARLRYTQPQICLVLSRKMIGAQPNTFGLSCSSMSFYARIIADDSHVPLVSKCTLIVFADLYRKRTLLQNSKVHPRRARKRVQSITSLMATLTRQIVVNEDTENHNGDLSDMSIGALMENCIDSKCLLTNHIICSTHLLG
jgi:hypothetical protein